MISIKFDKDGLIPVIVQDYRTRAVLMQAYMNEESLKLTLETKSGILQQDRQKLWTKGEESVTSNM